MELYCNLAYKKCFEDGCGGWWCSSGTKRKVGTKVYCYLNVHKYGEDKPKKIKLITEFQWLMNKAIYEENK